MMCCKDCPFHPTLGNAIERCPRPVCNCSKSACAEQSCNMQFLRRCFQDNFVINRLYQEHPLAVHLAEHTFETACQRRDRSLLLALLHASTPTLRDLFWKRLTDFQPRILWMLNPIFVAAGLPPVPTLAGLGTREQAYRDALSQNPYTGRFLFNQETGPTLDLDGASCSNACPTH